MMSNFSFLTKTARRFLQDQEGRSAVGSTVSIGLLMLVAIGSVVFATTDGDPLGVYEQAMTQVYWSARCEEQVVGACQMAKIQWW